MKTKIILASTSRYRQELLQRLQLRFEVESPRIEEVPARGETPTQLASRLALEKANAVAARHAGSRTLVIGSDQVADLSGLTLGKPGSRENARKQLQAMCGKLVTFYTAVALIDCATSQSAVRVIPTSVTMREYSDQQIDFYLDHEDALDCAGSAKSEGLGGALIAAMTSDDPTALIGLPLIALTSLLAEFGVEVLGGSTDEA